MKRNKRLNIKEVIREHIINNGKEYIVVTLIFIIGIFLGVLFVNNMQEATKVEVQNYINNFIEKFKAVENLDRILLLKTTIFQNIVLTLIIWFFGTTVIGLPVVFGMIIYRGFCLGYTIAATISTLRIIKRVIICIYQFSTAKRYYNSGYFGISCKWI